MNKILNIFLVLFFALSVNGNAATQKLPAFSEKDIIVDSDTVPETSFSPKFKAKYTDDAFIYETKMHELNAWDRFVAWITKVLSKIFSFSDNKATSGLIEIVLKIIAVLIIIFVVYLIVKSILNKEGQWIFGKNSDRGLLTYDDIERNLQTADFQKLISNALQTDDRRLCIRYYYLWLLKRLSEQEIIVWDIEKTNSDYLYEIKNDQIRTDFQYLSYVYNHVWYGEFDLDSVSFERAKNAFDSNIKYTNR